MKRRLRIVFLAVDDEFAGLMQRPLYARHPEWVVGTVLSSRLLHGKSQAQATWFLLRHSGPVYVAEMIRMKIMRRWGRRKDVPSTLAQAHGVPSHTTRDINGPESVEQLRAWQPHLVISTNFSQYVGKTVRGVPTVGAWNLHKSYLPHYRGMAPSFYALLEGAASVGATLHLLAKGFDTGDILCQVQVQIQHGDTVYELNRRTADAGGHMLAQYLETFDPQRISATPQPAGNWTTYSYPTRTAIRAFRSKGLRF